MSEKRHEVSQDDVEAAYYICRTCGAELEGDGDGWWHKDPDLNPQDAASDSPEKP